MRECAHVAVDLAVKGPPTALVTESRFVVQAFVNESATSASTYSRFRDPDQVRCERNLSRDALLNSTRLDHDFERL